MDLSFPNVSLLAFNQENRFFDAGYNYSNIQKLTINGYILDLISAFGISGVWTGQQGILNTVANNNNFQSLNLNGVQFGSGRINNINFDQGNDVKIDKYTANITIYQTGNLYNLNQNYYSGIDISNFQYLTNYNENYNFNLKENGGYSYNHSANITFNSGVGTLNAISAAKSTAKSLFTGFSLGFAFYSGYTSKIGKRFYTESYNKITNNCSFNEIFDFDIDSGNYSIVRTNKFDINEHGIINVNETARIKGIVRPTYQYAVNACDGEMNNSFSRCSGIYNLYAPATSYPLISYPTIRGKTIDLFNNDIGYDIAFSNDISNSGIYTWSYVQNLSFSESISRMVEEGEIIGRGQNRSMAYQNAQIGYGIMTNGVCGRTSGFYLNHSNGSGYNFCEFKDESYSPYKGIIRYNYKFSNENVVVGTSGIKKIDFQIQGNTPVYIENTFNIFNYKQIIQPGLNDTMGSKDLKLKLYGERINSLNDYLGNALYQINANAPTGLDPFISNTIYSFNPNQNIVDINVNWRYSVTPNQTIQI